MTNKLFEIDPHDLTPEERRAVIFITHGRGLCEFPEVIPAYEENMTLQQANYIKKDFKADFNAGVRTAERFFQLYALASRSATEVRARIAETTAEIERAKRALCIYCIYTRLKPPLDWGGHPSFNCDLTTALKDLTNTSPKLKYDTVKNAYAVVAWDAMARAAAEAYWEPRLKQLSNFNYIKALAFALDEEIKAVADDINQLYHNGDTAMESALANRELYRYFINNNSTALKAPQTITALRSFNPRALLDVYNTFYEERKKNIERIFKSTEQA